MAVTRLYPLVVAFAILLHICNIANADEPLQMSELKQVHHKDDVETTKFILKMLDEHSDHSLNDQCDSFVAKLVNDFMDEIKKKVNCRLRGECGEDAAFLDMKGGPALRDLFNSALTEPEEDEKKQSIIKKENEEKAFENKRELGRNQEGESKSRYKASVQSTNRDSHEVEKIIAAAGESKDALNKARAIVDEKLKHFASAKMVTDETIQDINDILDYIKEDCKKVEIINSKCKVSVNVESLQSGLESLFDQLDDCMKKGPPCTIIAPFPKVKGEERKSPEDLFIEITNELNGRAMSKMQQGSFNDVFKNKEERAGEYVDLALDINKTDNGAIKHLLASKMHDDLIPRRFRNCSKLYEQFKFLRHKNLTMENKYYDLVKECVELKSMDGSYESKDVGTEEKNREFHCEEERRNNVTVFCPRGRSNAAEAEVFHGECFAGSPFEEHLIKRENGYWWNSSSSEKKRNICGRPKFFDVDKGLNGAAVSLYELLPKKFSETLVRDSNLKDQNRRYDVKAVSDSCGHDAHHALNVYLHETNLVVEINCSKMGGCGKYMCDDAPSAVSEVHIAYRAHYPENATHNFHCKWITFAAARVQGSTVTIGPPSCDADGRKDNTLVNSQSRSRRRRRLLTTDRRNSAGSCC